MCLIHTFTSIHIQDGTTDGNYYSIYFLPSMQFNKTAQKEK